MNALRKGMTYIFVTLVGIGLVVVYTLYWKPSPSKTLLARMEALSRKKDRLLSNGGSPKAADVEHLLKEYNDLHQEIQESIQRGNEGEGAEKGGPAQGELSSGHVEVVEFNNARLDLNFLWLKLKRAEAEKEP